MTWWQWLAAILGALLAWTAAGLAFALLVWHPIVRRQKGGTR